VDDVFSFLNFNANMILLLSSRSSVACVVFSIRLVRGWWLPVMHLMSNIGGVRDVARLMFGSESF
jgi:uncharacterized membrane protein YccF (DUF307 family)